MTGLGKYAEIHLWYADFAPPKEGYATEFKGAGGWFMGIGSGPIPRPPVMRRAFNGEYTHLSIEWIFWRSVKGILNILARMSAWVDCQLGCPRT